MITRTKIAQPPSRPGPSRRAFLKGMGAASAGVTLAGSSLAQRAAEAATADHRSLVCIFLHGGADSFNLYIPRDHAEPGSTHADYAATRGALALDASELLGIHDGAFGLNPGLPHLASIAASGRLAVLRNVGPLDRPMTAAQFSAGSHNPDLLFAHDAQQKLWRTGRSSVAHEDGWGGAIAAAAPGAPPVPPAFSISGFTSWLSSSDVGYTRLLANTRIERLMGYDSSRRHWIPSFAGLEQVMETALTDAAATGNPLDAAAAQTIRQSVVATEQLEHVVADTPENDVGMHDVSSESLGGRLRQVARLIRNREALGMPRQVFYVEMPGWDTHGNQRGRFPSLLRELNDGIGAFQESLDAMGVAESVTTFTLSDFGRTLTSNGDATDHGWGGNAFVFGGAVKSGAYGTFPTMSVSHNPDDTGDGRGNFAGRMVPTTSVSQYAATLATWMGLSPSQLQAAFPDLANFATPIPDFLNP